MTTHTGHGITELKALLEPPGRRDDHVITTNVTEALVDELKPVEIEINHHEHNRGLMLTPCQSLMDPLEKKGATAPAGQGIAQGIMNGLLLGALTVGDLRLRAGDFIRCDMGPANHQAPRQHQAATVNGMMHPFFNIKSRDDLLR